ncbi:MAG TPA: bifunctional 4-hydroxy-2-oxoglutarate aldolase/2-dehydro-3-deoxy-phosphogluconate aldolase [Rudaea sp.]|jgi:2-dehydro-3-deoxyphosphogluconate aldolase/(4S)-4-hydroxy-2-oxoglutarate aldolase|nr:bifunctional 4-hydroxy-2-oxoglutarate aldolase/2-dehydro-3-deoxy-phosphogluconate aldolase [Rudaea sp.]
MNSTVQQRQDRLEPMLRLAPVIAIVTIDDVNHAMPLAKSLLEGGVRAIEVTLRTSAALASIEAIRGGVPDASVGAGTVLTPADVTASENAGALFFVSPGSSPLLIDAMGKSDVPWLPGAASASEAMALFERGYRLQKFFPAEPAGGVDFLRSLAAPLPKIKFCPTGGIRAQTMAIYLELPNVICVGGSWLSPANVMRDKDWKAITALARAATAGSQR